MFETRPLTRTFGVEILGIDPNTITAGQRFDDLRALFEDHSALLFRGFDLTDESHLRLARLFGPIEDRNADDRPAGAAFQIPKVSNVTEDGGTTGATDLATLQLQANFQWHCDSTFMPTPALVNILTARVVTTTGGATELASTRAAFAAMEPAWQETLRGTTLTHHYAHSRARTSPELAAQPMFHKWPAQTWPAIWRNPVNGREAVYVASHAYAVNGQDGPAAQAFIDALVAECTRPELTYVHHWQAGDVLLWDQRAVLHRGTPWPHDQPRTLSSICVSATEADGLATMRGAA